MNNVASSSPLTAATQSPVTGAETSAVTVLLTHHQTALMDEIAAACLASTTFPGRRQLFLPIDDNYSFDITSSSSTLMLTGAEALQGCTLSADSGARPGGAG